ncbi:hypothetical protein QQF73_04975 [Marinobacter sp. M216]|uniref:DUF2147 domain-containing protein n=1 Tax=Marinobacter albus TaxID=3030833 RepID=A0ABT7HAS4_9GAMM|nr:MULTISPECIES: hypothetical protein [unclassified Marinobacter]MBW7470760.1 hypothetical protein [Marinobacter sp. F4218]MDK9556970.1 hypothetical protein [Marinobacter sp. M216]
MQHSPDHILRHVAFPVIQPTQCLPLRLVLALMLSVSPVGVADNQMPVATALDGKIFESQLGLKGEPLDVEDRLVFEDGQFVSEECERTCGYAKVEYWVRAQDDAIQMRAEVPCLHSGAVMYWRGTVRGDEIEGSFTWINKRWYWTFEKEFWFKGKLVQAGEP